jgi:cytochrome c-type biogenesis protein CcmH/NrfG
MSFWRKQVIQPALDDETRKQMQEQIAWIAREPDNARPYLHLAEFYRMEGRQDEALGLMLHAVQLEPGFIAAHAGLSELYAIRADYPAAWRHARVAEQGGETRGVELLQRYGVAEN